jgi:hypothetical protein
MRVFSYHILMVLKNTLDWVELEAMTFVYPWKWSSTDFRSINLVLFQRYVFGSIRAVEPRCKGFNIECVKCIELVLFSHHFVRMTLVCKIRAENWGIFPSDLDGSWKHTELGRIRGFDFRLAIKVKFDWYSFDKPCFVSTICIREYSNVWTSFQTVQYWMCELHRFSAFFASFCTYEFGLQN